MFLFKVPAFLRTSRVPLCCWISFSEYSIPFLLDSLALSLFSKLDFGPFMLNNEEIRVGLEVLVIEMHLSNIEESAKITT